MSRLRGNVVILVLSIFTVLLVGIATANEEEITDKRIPSDDVQPHPDPNDEDHEGMIYVGRTCSKTGRRLLANESYAVQYIFGSSYEHIVDTDKESTKANERKLKKFGHVDTHPIDGGVVPQQLVSVEPFWLDAKPVSTAEFAQFVARTSYVTEAEKFGWSYVLDSMVQHASSDHVQSLVMEGIDYRKIDFERDPVAEYWRAFQFTFWDSPYGQRTKSKPSHPVVHVSHRDAAEYCKWRNNARLPGEREYEAASRWIPPPTRGDDDEGTETEQYIPPRYLFSWGNDTSWEIAYQHANLWGPGTFPDDNLALDGYFGTSPVGKYPPNHNGFYDLTGNVWEWMRGGSSTERILRGGSFVDTLDGSVNHAATLGARATVHGTTTSSNIGFRCAKSVTKRIEHHWAWHDIELHGPLSPEDEYIDPNDEDKDGNNDDETSTRKKKKVQVKNEQIRTEL